MWGGLKSNGESGGAERKVLRRNWKKVMEGVRVAAAGAMHYVMTSCNSCQ